MAKINVKIYMPSEKKMDEMVDSVILPGIEGDFEVMIDHTPLITKLRPGTLRVYKNEHAEYYALHDGFVTIENNNVLIVSEGCENKKEINIERAEAAKQRAEKRIADTTNSTIDFRRAEIALKKAIARIDTMKT